MAKKRNTQFDTREVRWDDEEMKKRIEERRRKKVLTLFAIVIAFVFLGTMCGKDIVRLKAENRALKKQQIALEHQRDALQEELRNASNQEYIKEQAKKQLRLLNPGEILFTFDEEQPEEDAEDAENAEEPGKDKGSGKDKDGDSDE